MNIFSDFFRNLRSEFEHTMDAESKFRREFTEEEAALDKQEENYALYAGERVIPIQWTDFKVDLLPYNCLVRMNKRDIRKIVTHWDATLSTARAKKILKKRKLSAHFSIDNDGTIVQFVDVMDKAWHAKNHNQYTIGIEFSNAFYLKYQKTYERMGLANRPVITSKVHGVTYEHLGYYPRQIEAYKALIAGLTEFFEIPLVCPMKNGELDTGKNNNSCGSSYKGIVSHFNLTTNKIDCAGLPLDKILKEIEDGN
jgi:hypothetical protein